MPGSVFFYSAEDPSVAFEALRRGYFLVVKKHYDPEEHLLVLSKLSNAALCSFSHFYVLPGERFFSEISVASGVEKQSGKNFRYIRDRVGAASIVLALNRRPSKGEVSVGSLEFEARTYVAENEPLEPRPPVFSSAFQNLRSFIKRSAQPVSNRKFPKTVYVFPQAMRLLRQDFSLSPWSSLDIAD